MSSTTDDALVQIQKLRWAIVEAHPPGLPSRRGTASVTHRSGRSPSRPLSQDLFDLRPRPVLQVYLVNATPEGEVDETA
jgi:hypothetical protein